MKNGVQRVAYREWHTRNGIETLFKSGRPRCVSGCGVNAVEILMMQRCDRLYDRCYTIHTTVRSGHMNWPVNDFG